MRHLLIFAIAFFSMNVSFTQETMQGLVNDLTKYLESMEKKKYDQVINYAHPKLWEVGYTPESMANSLKTSFDSENIEITIGNFDISSIFIKEINSSSYAVINYTQVMKCRLVNEKLRTMTSKLNSSFSENFGKENVTYDEETYTFNIFEYKRNIAEYIGDKWHFIENSNDTNSDTLAKIFDKEVLDQLAKLGTHY